MRELPLPLQNVVEETTVVGDIDQLIRYIESGQNVLDWMVKMEKSRENDINVLRNIFLSSLSDVR